MTFKGSPPSPGGRRRYEVLSAAPLPSRQGKRRHGTCPGPLLSCFKAHPHLPPPRSLRLEGLLLPGRHPPGLPPPLARGEDRA